MSLNDEWDEESEKAVQKALGEPVFVSLSDEAIRVRRNLLIVAFIAAAYKLSGLKITSFKPLGIEFDNYPQATIDIAMFILVLYNFINFFWISFDAMQECRIRLTGTRLAFVTTGQWASKHCDYPNDPRQSSLMTWWKEQAGKIGSFKPIIVAMNTHESMMREHANGLSGHDSKILQEKANELSQIAGDLNRKLDAIHDALNAKRVIVSLSRFEKSYKYFSYSQLARWFCIDWGAPIFLGALALYLTLPLSPFAQILREYFM